MHPETPATHSGADDGSLALIASEATSQADGDGPLQAIRSALASFDFRVPRALPPPLQWLHGAIENGSCRPGRADPLPDQAAALTPNQVRALAAIESHMVRAIAGRAGLPAHAIGFPVAGTQLANRTALACAVAHADPFAAVRGNRTTSRATVLYVSSRAQLAWSQIAHKAGIHRRAIHPVPTDEAGRIIPAKLRAAIRGDLERGLHPAMVVGMAGAVSTGAIDPLMSCAAIAHAHGAWFHIDAGLGGALLASDRLRPALEGFEAADSLAIDLQASFAMPTPWGLFLSSHPRIRAPFRDIAAQRSAVGVGLLLFLGLAANGWGGVAERVERAVRMANLLRARLEPEGWTVVSDPVLPVVCAVPPEGAPAASSIAAEAVAAGFPFVSSMLSGAREMVRIGTAECLFEPGETEALLQVLLRFKTRAASVAAAAGPPPPSRGADAGLIQAQDYRAVIDEIGQVPWQMLGIDEMSAVARAVHHVAINHRESLELACALYPADPMIARMARETIESDALSPQAGVAGAGERMNRDEYLRRSLLLNPLPADLDASLDGFGEAYLAAMRSLDPVTRALSVAGDGLEQTFRAMLQFSEWETPLLKAFERYLLEHVRFEGETPLDIGRGGSSLVPDNSVLPVWTAFRSLLGACVPRLAA